jgi:hypothetical protein
MVPHGEHHHMRCYTTFLAAGETGLFENVSPGTLAIGQEGASLLMFKGDLMARVPVEQFELAYASKAPAEDWTEAPGEMSLSSLDEWTTYFRQALGERVEALRAAFYSEFKVNPEVAVMCIRRHPVVHIVDDDKEQGYQATFVCGLAIWASEPKELANNRHDDEFGFQRPWERENIEFLDGRKDFMEWASVQLHNAILGTPVS